MRTLPAFIFNAQRSGKCVCVLLLFLTRLLLFHMGQCIFVVVVRHSTHPGAGGVPSDLVLSRRGGIALLS